jgi:hypothetical protein
MNGCIDLDINCQVRKVLVRHWIDLGKVSMRTTRGVVHLSGELRKLYHAREELNTALVLTLVSEIRRIRNVRRVNTDFDNWQYKDGTWQMSLSNVFRSEPASAAAGSAEPETAKTYDVEEVLPDEQEKKKLFAAAEKPEPAGS